MQVILHLVEFSLFSSEYRLLVSQFMLQTVLHLEQSLDVPLEFQALLLYVADPVSLFSSHQVLIIYIQVSEVSFLRLMNLIKLLILSLLF